MPGSPTYCSVCKAWIAPTNTKAEHEASQTHRENEKREAEKKVIAA
jgi:hypothetical protein